MCPSGLHHTNEEEREEVERARERIQKLLLLFNPICLTHRGREGKERKIERERERGREEEGGRRRMRTKPDQAEGEIGGVLGRGEVLFRERQGERKNQREAGWGVGLQACACVCESEREKAASQCACVLRVCLCVCVSTRSVPFLSLFDY